MEADPEPNGRSSRGRLYLGRMEEFAADPVAPKFAAQGLQTAAGVPLMCDEPADFQTFRVGLFGLDKLHHIDRTVKHLETALDTIVGKTNVR